MSLKRLLRRWLRYPFATNLSLVSIPIGILALIIGPPISRSFSLVYHAPDLVYGWGALLCVSGVTVLIGILRVTPSVELTGLVLLAPLFVFYAVSVLLALGVGGLVAGPIVLALALSCLLRASNIWQAARKVGRE